jgi:hypothetical protein
MVAAAPAQRFGFYTGSENPDNRHEPYRVSNVPPMVSPSTIRISTAAGPDPDATEWGLGIMAQLLAGLSLAQNRFQSSRSKVQSWLNAIYRLLIL